MTNPSPQQPYPGQPFPSQPEPPMMMPLGAASPEDLTLPLYGATFGQAIKRFFAKYATFSGRASLSEYWFAQLFLAIIGIIPAILVVSGMGAFLTTVDANSPESMPQLPIWVVLGIVLSSIISLAVLIPSLAITWRRLHDGNFSGAFFFLSMIPGGSLVLLILTLMPSNPAGARFDQR